MSVNLYNGFHNEIAGESFRCVSFDKRAFVFEWNVQPDGYVPFEHIHLNQDEIFHIKQGEIKMTIDGKEHIGRAGETIIIPRGKRHIARNNKCEPLSCIVEYRPGLDTYKFFQCFAGLTIDQDTDKKGQINIPKMLYFTKRMKAQCITRPTSIPAPIFHLALNVCYIAGRLLGWNKLFEKYTTPEKAHSPARRARSASLK
jgi:quercetin dioxygenase-like cupin family protein